MALSTVSRHLTHILLILILVGQYLIYDQAESAHYAAADDSALVDISAQVDRLSDDLADVNSAVGDLEIQCGNR